MVGSPAAGSPASGFPPRSGARPARRRSGRGREPRGPLLPSTVPAHTSRAERFDGLVLQALGPIDRRWHDRLSQLDVAVDEVPPVRGGDLSQTDPAMVWPPEVVAEGAVPLARLVPAGVDARGATTRARIVLFRRPLELRADDPSELAELLHEVLLDQVATYLGLAVEDIEPDRDAPDGGGPPDG